jgi:hypothetical protein
MISDVTLDDYRIALYSRRFIDDRAFDMLSIRAKLQKTSRRRLPTMVTFYSIVCSRRFDTHQENKN